MTSGQATKCTVSLCQDAAVSSAILCRTVCAKDRERIARAYNDGGGQRRRSPATEHTGDDGLVNGGPAHSFVYLFGLTLHMRIAEYRAWPLNNG